MAKGLAVVKGRNTVVFKALEDGTIKFGNDGLDGKPAIDAAVSLKGSLKLDIAGKADGHFLKTDADGNASWAQIQASDVDVSASGLDLESHLSVMELERGSLEDDLSAETSARIAADSALDGRLTTAESNISALNSELSTLIGGDVDQLAGTLSNIREIQEYLDGDGVDVQNLVSVAGTAIGDLTSFTTDLSIQLSADIAELSEGGSGEIGIVSQALSVEIINRAAGDQALADDLSAETSARIAADSELATDLSAEIVNRIADVDAEEARASGAEYALSLAIEDLDAEVSTVLSSAVVEVVGTANEVEVSTIEDVNGSTVVVGLPDDVSVAQDLAVGQDLNVGRYLTVDDATSLNGDVTAGNAHTDKVIVNGNFQIPRMTRAEAMAVYGYNSTTIMNPTDHSADWATAGANDGNGFNGHMFYLADEDATATDATTYSAASEDEVPFPEGQKWYFCENGVWHASFFYA